jgi:putative tryptophan/tyrosine transport system substrate-binding protein
MCYSIGAAYRAGCGGLARFRTIQDCTKDLSVALRQPEPAGDPLRWPASIRSRASCTVLLGTFAALIFGASPAFSQQSSKPVRVGVLMSGFEPFYAAHDRGLVAGLRDHGYIEGKNLIIERRYGHLDRKRYSVLAQELAGMNLDAIVTVCTGTTLAAKGATNSTPIVMLSVPDPVGQGLAASLARPGANVTGRSSQHFDLVPKILQLFHEAVPKTGRIAVLVNTPNPLHQEAWAEALAAAQSLNVDLMRIEMQGAEGLGAALESVAKSNANALFVLPDDPPTFNLRRRIIAFARERALPFARSLPRGRGGWSTHQLRRKLRGRRPGGRFARREGRPWHESGRATDRATDSLRVDGEPEGSERIGHHDSGFIAGAGGSGD